MLIFSIPIDPDIKVIVIWAKKLLSINLAGQYCFNTVFDNVTMTTCAKLKKCQQASEDVEWYRFLSTPIGEYTVHYPIMLLEYSVIQQRQYSEV